MDERMRRLLLPDPADAEEARQAELLQHGEPEALLQLYDDIAPLAYAWAISITRSRSRATQILRQTFQLAARQPWVFADRRISCRGWILLETHHLAQHATEPNLGHHSSAPARPVTPASGAPSEV